MAGMINCNPTLLQNGVIYTFLDVQKDKNEILARFAHGVLLLCLLIFLHSITTILIFFKERNKESSLSIWPESQLSVSNLHYFIVKYDEFIINNIFI